MLGKSYQITGNFKTSISSTQRKEDKETWRSNMEEQKSIQRMRLANKKWESGLVREIKKVDRKARCAAKRKVEKLKKRLKVNCV